MKRYGSVVGLKADRIEEYKKLHVEVWPEVLRTIRKCGMQNYSIYLHRFDDGVHYLFSYFEYVGANFDDDMAAMAADPVVQKWWSICKPCHRPLDNRAPGEWWASMEEVFHSD